LLGAGELPALKALAAEGTLVDLEVSCGATDTKAGWTQFLTGLAPETTGVVSNSNYRPIPEGLTVFERLKRHFGTNGIATLAVIGKKGNIDNDPPRRVPYERYMLHLTRQKARRTAERAAEQGGQPVEGPGITEDPAADQGSAATGGAPPTGVGRRTGGRRNGQAREIPEPVEGKKIGEGTVVRDGDQWYVEIPGKPYCNASRTLDVWENGLTENERVGERALQVLDQYKDQRFFFFIHFAQPDHAGHQFGENSEEYSQGIISDDEWTGKIVAKLRELGIHGETLIYVVADHGFDEGLRSHSYAPYMALGTDDPLVTRPGTRLDVAPTILKRFGVDLATLQPPLDGTPLDEPAPADRVPTPPARPKDWPYLRPLRATPQP
jgi:hypothetical protein